MQALLIYLLKVTVCSGILFLYYCIALRNKRFHYYNRFYLLMSVVLSLVLPLLHIELWQFYSNNKQVVELMNVAVVDNTEVDAAAEAFRLTWNSFTLIVYVFVAMSLFAAFLSGIIKLYNYKRIYPSKRLGNILFINTDLEQAPFSFFNKLFWKNSLDIDDATGRQIFKHELTHIEQKHSLDKLFLRITVLLLWINPFYWLIQKELGLIHEFIADEKAIENRSAEEFALVLLHSQYGKNIFSPAQSFNYSPIKRRLLMLTTSAKTSYSYARRILVLPLLAITFLLFAFKLKEDQQSSAINHTNAPFTLLIDAGHGGDAAGAINAEGLKEKDLNLSVAKKVEELAPEYGITAKMTRTEDVTVDLKTRMNLIEAIRPNAFISVHVSTTEEAQTGKNEINVYIPRNETNANYIQSRLLGSSLLQVAKNDFPVNSSLMQRKNEGIYVIDQNPYPAVIIECGYMNNAENIRQLQDAAKTEQLARDILQGVVAYANAASQATKVTITDTAKNPPLYILGDKELTPEEVKTIDANKIESISVLKDENAIKQYGEKGKNGVVIITLKKEDPKADSVDIDLKTKSVRFPANDMTIQADKISMKTDAKKQPVIYIDGKLTSNAELQKLNPNDIYSMTVWKGEDAVKKYGEKGKNGVIEVTTKNSKNEQQQTPSINPPKTVKNSINYPESDSTVDFTGNTSLHRIVEVKYNDTSGKLKLPDKILFAQTQVAPKFPGGNDAWLKYLQKNLHTDILTSKKAPTGTYTVTVSFVVDTEGNLSDVKADNDPGYGTGAEAVRVIKSGPKWIPAEQNGHAVTAKTKQAITFRVEE